MTEDRLTNVLATFIQNTIDGHHTNVIDLMGIDDKEATNMAFEEGGNYYLWSLAREMEIEDAVTQELYHRDGGPE